MTKNDFKYLYYRKLLLSLTNINVLTTDNIVDFIFTIKDKCPSYDISKILCDISKFLDLSDDIYLKEEPTLEDTHLHNLITTLLRSKTIRNEYIDIYYDKKLFPSWFPSNNSNLELSIEMEKYLFRLFIRALKVFLNTNIEISLKLLKIVYIVFLHYFLIDLDNNKMIDLGKKYSSSHLDLRRLVLYLYYLNTENQLIDLSLATPIFDLHDIHTLDILSLNYGLGSPVRVAQKKEKNIFDDYSEIFLYNQTNLDRINKYLNILNIYSSDFNRRSYKNTLKTLKIEVFENFNTGVPLEIFSQLLITINKLIIRLNIPYIDEVIYFTIFYTLKTIQNNVKNEFGLDDLQLRDYMSSLTNLSKSDYVEFINISDKLLLGINQISGYISSDLLIDYIPKFFNSPSSIDISIQKRELSVLHIFSLDDIEKRISAICI